MLLAEMKLPVFLPGNNRDWQQVDGVATIDSEGEIHVKLLKPENAQLLVEMGEEGILMQLSFDYRMDAATVEKINTQHQKKD